MRPQDFKRWRKSQLLSQKQAAEALGLKRRVVQYYEKGERDGEKVKIPRSVRLACAALAHGLADWQPPPARKSEPAAPKPAIKEKASTPKPPAKAKEPKAKAKPAAKVKPLAKAEPAAKAKPAARKPAKKPTPQRPAKPPAKTKAK